MIQRAIFLTLLLSASAAEAEVVTFEALSTDPSCVFQVDIECQNTIISPGGFVFFHQPATEFSAVGVADLQGREDVFSVVVGQGAIVDTIVVTHDSAALFDLNSIDLYVRQTVENYQDPLAGYGPGNLFAYDQNDVLISQLSFGDIETPDGWQELMFDAAWSDIARLEIRGQAVVSFGTVTRRVEIDTFSATVVPVPAAFWLFASALAVLAYRRDTDR